MKFVKIGKRKIVIFPVLPIYLPVYRYACPALIPRLSITFRPSRTAEPSNSPAAYRFSFCFEASWILLPVLRYICHTPVTRAPPVPLRWLSHAKLLERLVSFGYRSTCMRHACRVRRCALSPSVELSTLKLLCARSMTVGLSCVCVGVCVVINVKFN